MGCVILLLHSLSPPYNYFGCFYPILSGITVLHRLTHNLKKTSTLTLEEEEEEEEEEKEEEEEEEEEKEEEEEENGSSGVSAI